jgi:peptidoglycan/LPS O-acetylase OafA/YrhL
MINITTQHQNHRNNFTALRWLAAGLVLYGHSFTFLGLPAPTFMSWVPLGVLGVYIFFSISGYLVAQSWENDPNLSRFIIRRSLRIFPALVVCISLSVFVLGPWLTSLPISEYFSSPHTRDYFLNCFLYISNYLPGVFGTNRIANAVNGSLWSLPVEFSMYLVLAILGFLRVPRSGWIFAAVGLMLLSKLWAMPSPDQLIFYRTDVRQVVICGVYFWVGAAAFRYQISKFFSISNVLIVVIIWLMLSRWPQAFVMGSWVILPFLVIAFGLSQSSLLSRIANHDYSYGIYIYAFPVQQAIVHFWPYMPLKLYLTVTGLLTLILAAASWHLIEKPALKMKPSRTRAMEPQEIHTKCKAESIG